MLINKIKKEYFRVIEKLFKKTPKGKLLDGYGHFKKSYSQNGEDVILDTIMKKPPNYKGFFIDIGSYHPFSLSNTAYYYQNDWSGINIDADPNAINKFKNIRTKDLNINAGISAQEDNLTLYVFDNPAYNTFDKERSIHYEKHTDFKITSEVPVKTLPLSKILDEKLPNNQKIDFMDIDVEGLELEVLKSNNWDKYRPGYLLLEITSDQDEICEYLDNLNYKIIMSTCLTTIFKDMSKNNG